MDLNNKIRVQIIKVKYRFKDGNEVSGVELHLAPKVKKFIRFGSDEFELLGCVGNKLKEWFNQVDYGDDIILYAPAYEKNVRYGGGEKVEVNFE